MFYINRFSILTFEVERDVSRGHCFFLGKQAVVSQVGVQKKEESS